MGNGFDATKSSDHAVISPSYCLWFRLMFVAFDLLGTLFGSILFIVTYSRKTFLGIPQYAVTFIVFCLPHFHCRYIHDSRSSGLMLEETHLYGNSKHEIWNSLVGNFFTLCRRDNTISLDQHYRVLSFGYHTGAGDLNGEPIGYVTGVLAVLVHAAYLVLIQKTSIDSDHGPLTAQYAIAIIATPILIICSFASMDAIYAWSFPGWKDPGMVCTFIICNLIGCAMNFTTLHCTYINSAVTTSFVGVVKSIVTITVGMLAFNDVEPTSLFIAGVVVNTIGSIIYCIAKYIETRRQINYEDLEKEARKEEEESYAQSQQPSFPMEEVPKENNSNGSAILEKEPNGDTEMHRVEQQDSTVSAGQPSSGITGARNEEPSKSSFKDAYLGVWRSIRGMKFMKKECLIENEELPSP